MKPSVKFDSLTAECIADVVYKVIPYLASNLREDYLEALIEARENEDSETAKNVCDLIIENAKIAKRDEVPICQDTGSVWVLLEIGENYSALKATSPKSEEFKGIPTDIFSKVDEAVASAYVENNLRMSIVKNALVDRTNTNNNAPALTEIRIVPGDVVKLSVMLKGGGSENASRQFMLSPLDGSDAIVDNIISLVREKATNACPPLVIGIGIGASFDKVSGLSKRALLRAVGQNSADPEVAAFEKKILEAVNETGIGPGGQGGKTTALGVSIETAPTHIASLPVAVNLGCCATRSITIELER